MGEPPAGPGAGEAPLPKSAGESPPTPSPEPPGSSERRRARWADEAFGAFALAAAATLVALPVLLVLIVGQDAQAAIVRFGPAFLIGRIWDSNLPPVTFGASTFIAGTLETSAIALLIGVPLSLGGAVFLAELAPDWLRAPVASVVDLLAAVPSVVFGLWGLYVLVPYMRTSVDPFLAKYLGWSPLFAEHAGSQSGASILTASIILAIMILPTISSVSREALRATPDSQREAALSLGATRWEATRLGPLAYARTGIFGAAVLGLGRAMGETMAVTMTVGNSDNFASSLFDPGQTLSSKIAINFGNAVGLERSALVELGLILMALSLLVNVVARLLLRSMTRIGKAGV
ncbi:MAG: phosphate ABC transporter permease subunit PstC [Thermoplasmata archaeon]|nr:phosphate ABC transporter permease subunit PstC [Thermoplasmata archaeon]MCI4332642.1 phosphate ABC transporter permease subunit PstC [Thermoplasmata archaeon]MCI4360958.1 phosphate ABC transporter permease subunit PstC [Thermoplasmata archaeon]